MATEDVAGYGDLAERKRVERARLKTERIAELGLPALGTDVMVLCLGDAEFTGRLADVSFGSSLSFPVTLVLKWADNSKAVNWENVLMVAVND